MKGIKKIIMLCAVGTLFATTTLSASAAGLRDIFNAKYYADTYADLKAAFGYNEKALYKHFISFGLKENRRMSPVLDVQKYRETYADLDAAFGDNWDKYVEHYFTFGIQEKRTGGILFDPLAYAEAYPDIKAAFGDDIEAITRHYLTFGIAEGRTAGVTVQTESEASVPASAPAPVPAPEKPAPEEPAPSPAPEVAEVATNAELQQALEKGSANIKVTADITDMESITLSSGEVSIDLDGHTLSKTTTGSILVVEGSGVLTVKGGNLTYSGTGDVAVRVNGATLTLGDGLIVLSENSDAIWSYGGTIVVEETAELNAPKGWVIVIGNNESGNTKSDVTVKGELTGCKGITTNGLRKPELGDTLLIDGATITAEYSTPPAFGIALMLSGPANTTIRNSTITGSTTGVEIRAGQLTIESGTITGSYVKNDGAPDLYPANDGTTVDGVALAISQHCTRHDVTVTVAEGVILGTASDTAVVVTDTLVDNAAAGGTVSATINCTIPEGKKVRNGGTNVTVTGVAEGSLTDLAGNTPSQGGSSDASEGA